LVNPKINMRSLVTLLLATLIVISLMPIYSAYAGVTFTPKATMISKWIALCEAHPTEASYESIGKYYEGNDIYLFKIGNPKGGVIFFDAAMHGWEDIGTEIQYLWANWILTNDSEASNRILENNYVLFEPVVTWGGWYDGTPERGNANITNGKTYGVDINRNFVTGWTYLDGAGTPNNPSHGSSGADQNETQAVRYVFETYTPEIYVNMHYGGGPWLDSCGTNATITNLIKSKISQISIESGFDFPWSLGSISASGGYAVADANSFGANSWMWEIAANNGEPYHTGTGSDAYMHNAQTMTDIQTWYFPKMLPALKAMCEVVEVVSLLPSPTPSPMPTPSPTPSITPTPTPFQPSGNSVNIHLTGIINAESQKLQTNGSIIINKNGTPKTLISVNMDHNEYNKGFFTAGDITLMQAHGGNCLELNGIRIGYMMPSRGSIDSSYLAKLDSYVNLCESAKQYIIFTFEDMSYTTWNSQMPNWMLDGHGYGTAPYNETTVNQAVIDFFDTDNPLHNDNRQAFIDLWTFLANHYQNKQYAMFGIMNEPFSHCPITSRTQSQHLGTTYAYFMEQIVDAIHTVSDNLIFIDRPYVWYLSDVQPVHREGIVWEDHLYVNADTPTEIANWKSGIDARSMRFKSDFDKPLYIGEYGPFPTNTTGWQNIFAQLSAYLPSKTSGYGWHEWGALAGEYYNTFSVADSETLLTIVYPR
jgi:hypothetical protein